MTVELLRRAREGDAEAFCQLAEPCETRLYQQAYALCRNAASAEDLASETFIEAWKSLDRFDGRCRFSTWLYAILIHRAQKLFRKSARQPVLFEPAPGDDSEFNDPLAAVQDSQALPGERMAQNEVAEKVREVIETLPLSHQQVLLLRFYQDASLPEIAAALNLPLGTIKSRLHHALEKLRRSAHLLNLLKGSWDTRL